MLFPDPDDGVDLTAQDRFMLRLCKLEITLAIRRVLFICMLIRRVSVKLTHLLAVFEK